MLDGEAHAVTASAEPACRWYAVLTEARAEPLATHHLRRQGYGVLYLHYPAEVRHARRTLVTTRPYFPRYVFAAVAPDQACGPIGRSIGVAAVVQAAGEALEVPPEVIGELTSRADPNGLVAPPQAAQRASYAPGQEVTIAQGPFAGHAAVIILDDGDRIRATLRWFARDVTVTLEPGDLAGDIKSPALRRAPD